MKDFLGTGYDFPLRLAGDGKFKMVSGPDKVYASVKAILSTPVGTRIMLRDFGCRIHEITFENGGEAARSLGKFYVRQALEKWEPRISLDEDNAVDIQFDGPNAFIILKYRIVATNTIDNMVFPFVKGAA